MDLKANSPLLERLDELLATGEKVLQAIQSRQWHLVEEENSRRHQQIVIAFGAPACLQEASVLQSMRQKLEQQDKEIHAQITAAQQSLFQELSKMKNTHEACVEYRQQSG